MFRVLRPTTPDFATFSTIVSRDSEEDPPKARSTDLGQELEEQESAGRVEVGNGGEVGLTEVSAPPPFPSLSPLSLSSLDTTTAFYIIPIPYPFLKTDLFIKYNLLLK
ncbi:unnamed protein product [Nezara viridula]|uniref:Uncharacterized protein n=1 Tax=Nezara viridula TaxID=85310 RepID=A0A9P0HSS5_NEZVI|nr:unnamed protein product [Nezara viridula]